MVTPAPAPASGDAFGELEALFNEVQEGSHRPGDPAVSEPPVPVAEPLGSAAGPDRAPGSAVA
jgi:hypothetical protein